VQQKLDEPRIIDKLECTFDAKPFGIKFKKDAGMLKETLFGMERERLQCVKEELEKGLVGITVTARRS